MCRRIRQAGDGEQYMETLNWNPKSTRDDSNRPRYNVPPRSRPITLHRLGDGTEQAERMFWGYKPPWYKKRTPGNARLDKTIVSAPLWRPLLTKRIVVPAEGWFEWTGDIGDKQPWFITAKDDDPILIAGIAVWQQSKEVLAETGFAIVTDDSAGGMVDIHDRRPIVLTLDDALEWLDPDTEVDQAKQILSATRPESAFQWWQVTRAMGNSRYQMPDASEPLNI